MEVEISVGLERNKKTIGDKNHKTDYFAASLNSYQYQTARENSYFYLE